MKYLSRDEQRRNHSQNVMAAINLECHLHNLVRSIIEGDTTKLSEFQQFIQYAPIAMKERIDQLLNKE
jgi:hypothetical protein